uniref:CCHC-type domain-containing protein n=1 Tax=Octopus bimaculoides TaxID=37653 RepID=A0A0L8GR87_OCTBM
MYSENVKAIRVDKDIYKRLRDMCGSEIDPPGVLVEFDDLPPVIELKDLEPFKGKKKKIVLLKRKREKKVLVHIRLPDLHKIAEELVLADDTRLRIVVERRPPVCYACGIRGHMKAKCPLKSEREEAEKESREEEIATAEEEMEKKERDGKRKKNEEPTEERTQRPEPLTSKEEERRKKRLKSEKEEETETKTREEPLKGKHERVMVCYRKSAEIEKRISKMKSILRIKLADKEENQNEKAELLEDDRARRLKEIFGDRIENTAPRFRYDKLPSVVAFEDLMDFMV